MEFEWDPEKDAANYSARGISFRTASRIFEGRVIEWGDRRKDYGEVRLVALGEAVGVVLRVVYTMRGKRGRIISAHKASRKDRQRWQQ
jgi:uncharacterized protein